LRKIQSAQAFGRLKINFFSQKKSFMQMKKNYDHLIVPSLPIIIFFSRRNEAFEIIKKLVMIDRFQWPQNLLRRKKIQTEVMCKKREQHFFHRHFSTKRICIFTVITQDEIKLG
jgi:hypothetical protein